MNSIKSLITETEKEKEKLLKSLDGYGYSREDTLNELNNDFWNSDIDEDIKIKWIKLNSKLSALKLCQEIQDAREQEIFSKIDELMEKIKK
jgi:hypothetical protein